MSNLVFLDAHNLISAHKEFSAVSSAEYLPISFAAIVHQWKTASMVIRLKAPMLAVTELPLLDRAEATARSDSQ